jgi:hypothetical protein
MKKEMTVGYQNRQGQNCDLPTAPKLVIANHFLKKLSGFCIGDKVKVQYLPNEIIIKKLI